MAGAGHALEQALAYYRAPALLAIALQALGVKARRKHGTRFARRSSTPAQIKSRWTP